MKKTLTFAAVAALSFGAASAANITLYYSPSCPHCHHARDFISSTLIYEYPTLQVEEVNAAEQVNSDRFMKMIKDCDLPSGGVPVAVVDGKCIQGFGNPENTGVEYRTILDANLSADDAAAVAAAKAALAENADQYKSANASALNRITDSSAAKKNDNKGKTGTPLVFWGLLILLVGGLGFVLFAKKKK